MPCAESTPSPLVSTLTRVFLTVVSVSAVLSASAVTDAAACGPIDSPARGSWPHFNCDTVTRLELDFLNDDVEPPEAFNINAGAITVGESAEFRVYAATDDPRFFRDVTSTVRDLKFWVRGAPANRTARRMRYRDDDDNPRWVYAPRGRRSVRRTVSVDCAFRCGPPRVTYTSRFVLSILPEDHPAGG